MQSAYLEAIKSFEGFAARASWDYAQYSNGFGTRAKFPGEVIDRREAELRFKDEISKAESAVERFAPGLDVGTKAALTSLTYNAGTKWMQSGLGSAIKSGDFQTASKQLLLYNKGGGQVLPGLVARRQVEASWIGAEVASGQAWPEGVGAAEAVAAIGAATPASEGPTDMPTQQVELFRFTADRPVHPAIGEMSNPIFRVMTLMQEAGQKRENAQSVSGAKREPEDIMWLIKEAAASANDRQRDDSRLAESQHVSGFPNKSVPG